jgi:transposase
MECQCLSEPDALAQAAERTLTLTAPKKMRHLHFRSVEQYLLDAMLERCKAAGYLKARGRQRSDSTHVLASVRALNRLVLVGETVRHTLKVLAVSAPSGLKAQLQPVWIERYEKRMDEHHLPKGKEQRLRMASQIGADGRQLLQSLFAETTPRWLRKLEAVRILQRVWLEQDHAVPDEQALSWREESDQPPPAQPIQMHPFRFAWLAT